MQMAQFTGETQAKRFIISQPSRFWDDWKCYLLFLPIDIHVCHFHENLKETVLIFGMTTPICSQNHMPWYHSYSHSHLFNRQGCFWWRENEIISEGRVCTEPELEGPECPVWGQTPDSVDGGIVAAGRITTHTPLHAVFTPIVQLVSQRQDSCLL